jgi:hypothetical protein
MKSTLMIKDLALDKALDRDEMSAVRGGFNVSQQGGLLQNVAQGNGVGFALGSPNTNVGINAPVNTQTDVDLTTLNNILGNLGAKVAQI